VESLACVHDERLHGVPDADEVDRTGPGECRPEFPGHRVNVGRVVHLAGVFDEVFRIGPEQPALVQHARQRSHREGAATEAEQINAVVRLVAPHQMAVRILDVPLQSAACDLVTLCPHPAAVLFVLPAAGPNPRVVIRHLPLVRLGE